VERFTTNKTATKYLIKGVLMNLVSYQNSPIKVFYAEIGGELVECVDARELHTYLENNRQFTDWIKSRIEKYDFVENADFIVTSQKCEVGNGTKIDYTITSQMAEELGMVENNERGKEIRKFFSQCKKELRHQAAIAIELKTTNRALAEELNKKIVSEHKSKKTIKKLEDIALDANMKPEMVDKLLKVMSLRNKGLNNQLIASALGVSISNIENYASKLIGMGAIEPMAYSKQAAMFSIEG
jgi:phage anti-repressor protein